MIFFLKMESEAKISLGILGGWGVSPEAEAALFPAGTRVFPPTRENVARLAGAERVAGYSLGAWLLLDAASRGEFSRGNVTLYAPFAAFPRELERGGRVSATQVKFLRRWLKKSPSDALADFYARAGLSFSRADALPYRIEDLDAGLALLTDGFVERVPAVAESWEIVIGGNDALLDAEAVVRSFPKNPVRRVPAGTHDLLTLI